MSGAIVIGIALALTGALAEPATDYRKGIELWHDEVNGSGGLLGRQLELRLLDDRSDAAQSAPLYERLIREEKVDLLIGPYGSAATLGAAASAERARRVLINGSGVARAVHKRAPKYVFQSSAPYSAYGTGIIELAGEQGHRNLYVLARDDPRSREMAEGAREAAAKRGLAVQEIEVFRANTVDFAAQIAKARSMQADAWIAFCEPRDAAEMVKSLKRLGYAPRLFFAHGTADARFIRMVGQDGEFAMGAAEFSARLAANQAFAGAFQARWGYAPGTAAAQGYAAGTVLAAAVRQAGVLDAERLRETLVALEVPTVLGGYKVNPSTGEQLGAKLAVTQVLKGRPEVVWPREAASAAPVLPYPQWSERRVLKK